MFNFNYLENSLIGITTSSFWNSVILGATQIFLSEKSLSLFYHGVTVFSLLDFARKIITISIIYSFIYSTAFINHLLYTWQQWSKIITFCLCLHGIQLPRMEDKCVDKELECTVISDIMTHTHTHTV